MSTNLIIATFSSASAKRFETPDYNRLVTQALDAPCDFRVETHLRKQVYALSRLHTNLDQITIVVAQDSETDAELERFLSAIKRINGVPVVVLYRKNGGDSVGSWFYGMEKFPDFDYHIVTEDDYLFVLNRFDTVLVDAAKLAERRCDPDEALYIPVYIDGGPGVPFKLDQPVPSLTATPVDDDIGRRHKALFNLYDTSNIVDQEMTLEGKRGYIILNGIFNKAAVERLRPHFDVFYSLQPYANGITHFFVSPDEVGDGHVIIEDGDNYIPPRVIGLNQLMPHLKTIYYGPYETDHVLGLVDYSLEEQKVIWDEQIRDTHRYSTSEEYVPEEISSGGHVIHMFERGVLDLDKSTVIQTPTILFDNRLSSIPLTLHVVSSPEGVAQRQWMEERS